MAYKSGERKETLLCTCATQLEEGRAVNITKSTMTAAYCTAGQVPDAVTVCKAVARNVGGSSYSVEVVPISNLGAYVAQVLIYCSGTVTKGSALEVYGSAGGFRDQASGAAVGLYAAKAGVSTELIGAYVLNKSSGSVVPVTEVDAATYTVLSTDKVIGVKYTDTGTVTVTIPSALIADSNFEVEIWDIANNASEYNITIATEGSETINEASSLVITQNSGRVKLRSNGTNLLATASVDSKPSAITSVDAATYTVLVTDKIIGVKYTDAGVVTVTVPSALITNEDFELEIWDIANNAGSNNITIATEGSETINEQATLAIAADSGGAKLRSDGTNLIGVIL